MKITGLNVEAFGIWKGLELAALPDSITVFYGPNEAGKTTLMQFVRTVLYGFTAERRERYLVPLHGERAGGTLRVAEAGLAYDVRRRWEPGDETSAFGDLLVTAEGGQKEGQARLTSLLSGIDESIYGNVFAVGLREIQELATLNDTAAAEQLYKLTGGLDRVSLVDVMRELETSRRRLLAPDDSPRPGVTSQIVQLLARWEELETEIEKLATEGTRWSQLVAHRESLRQDIADQEQTSGRLERQVRQLEVALAVRDTWQARAALAEQLSAIGPLPPLPERAVERLDALISKHAARVAQAKKLREERIVLRREAAALPINRPLWVQASRIEALSEHLPWITSLEQQLAELRAEVTQCDKELGICFEQMGASQPAGLAALPDVPKKKLETLRDPARGVAREQRRLKEAQEAEAQATREAANARQELETALVEQDETDLTAALEEAGDLAADLRRRVQLEERIDQMLRRRDDLEEDGLDLRENQVLPLYVLGAIGAVFILGVMLVLTGFFGGIFWSLSNATIWAMFGALLAGGAVAAKIALQRQAAARLEDCNRQLETVQKQLKEAEAERDTLDRELPSGGGALDSRLTDATERLAALEALLPLETKRQEAESRAKTATAAGTEAEAALKTARHRWRGALKAIGLPESLSPQSARQFAKGCGRTARLRRRREARLEEFKARERELAAFGARVVQLMQEAGLTPAANDPQSQLRQLISAAAGQRQNVEKRLALRKQNRALRKQQQQAKQSAENLRRRQEALIASAGAENESELRRLDDQQRRAEKLARERDDATGQIAFALAGRFTEDAIAEEISRHTPSELAARRDELAEELDKAQGRLTQMHERRGELNYELKSLAADRRLPEARLELSCVGEQLKAAIRRWQVLAVAGRLLEAIRALYETERQPETLGEASRYLRRLTAGRYNRIWTPLGEQALKIDNELGEPLSIDVLSSGTREAVFLSLRLALAAAYARRGARLPLVLDDVLVNFDTERGKAAAAVLADFARGGHQVLLFTCHEHMVRIFRDVQVEVRELPVRGPQAGSLCHEPPPAVEVREVELAKEPPPRKRRKRPHEEPAVPAAPPPLPARVVAPIIVESDTRWRDPLWHDAGAEPFAVRRSPPPPAVDLPLDIREEEFLYDDEPIVEQPAEEEIEDIWPGDEIELFDDDPTPMLQTVPLAAYPPFPRRFAWESPEMYWHDDRAA